MDLNAAFWPEKGSIKYRTPIFIKSETVKRSVLDMKKRRSEDSPLSAEDVVGLLLDEQVTRRRPVLR